jgi:hypothetical protein
MQSSATSNSGRFELALTIVVTVVGGKECVRRCLKALCPQVDFVCDEIIVPYDTWSADVGELCDIFPRVNFHFISNLGPTASPDVRSHKHRLYDRRRAVGISIARGRLIALTEDYAVPAQDWCHQIAMAHEQPYAVIGGAIDNAADQPLNWALYYCDFGRYGTPLRSGETEYASDVNVAYKHEVLQSVRDIWRNTYHETSLHWTIRSMGETIFLDPRLLVFQQRPRTTLKEAFRERIEWGRVFAETRVANCGRWQRVGYAAGTAILPLILIMRVLDHMLRQGRSAGQMIRIVPLVAFLLVGWTIGEFSGYFAGPIDEDCSLTEIIPEA